MGGETVATREGGESGSEHAQAVRDAMGRLARAFSFGGDPRDREAADEALSQAINAYRKAGIAKVAGELEQAKQRIAELERRLERKPPDHGEKDGKHPNDHEPRDEERIQYLEQRGDDEGQGLDPYWKWGHAAGWNDHKRHVEVGVNRALKGTPRLPPMEQLIGFVEVEKQQRPEKTHIAEWALAEIERLQAAAQVVGKRVGLSDARVAEVVFEVLRKYNRDALWSALSYNSGAYEITRLRPEVMEVIRAVLAEAQKERQ